MMFSINWPNSLSPKYWEYGRIIHKYATHDDVIKWKHFPRCWPFLRGIHRPSVNFPHKGQWRGALMFSLICAWTDSWANNGDAGDIRRHRSHYYVIVMERWHHHVVLRICWHGDIHELRYRIPLFAVLFWTGRLHTIFNEYYSNNSW